MQADSLAVVQEQVISSQQVSESQARWPQPLLIAFRFLTAYVLLYALPFPLEQIPKVSVIANWYEKGWEKLVPWVGAHILHLSKPITYFMSGSGDKTSDWVQLLCQVVFAIVATVIWSALDRQRKNHNVLHAWMRVYLATYLGITMFGYGLSKVIPSQMPYPSLSHMMEPFGYQSPMGLLWSSIGAAPAYEIFAGAAETLAGILMFIPRMTTLGALVGMGDMANVFMLNMAYDVPVKQFSCHLMLFFGLLLIPDLKRLIDFFVLNRSPGSGCSFAVSRRRAPNYVVWGLRWALAGFAVLSLVVSNLQFQFTPEKRAKENPLYGIWRVDQFTLDGKDHPPLITDNERWGRMIFDFPGSTEIHDMQGAPLLDSIGAPAHFGTKIDKAKNTIELKKSSDPTWKFEAKYERPQPDLMTIDGQWDGKPIHLTLHKEEHRFFLSHRGFHWVNEVALGR